MKFKAERRFRYQTLCTPKERFFMDFPRSLEDFVARYGNIVTLREGSGFQVASETRVSGVPQPYKI